MQHVAVPPHRVPVIPENKDKCRYNITLDVFVSGAGLNQFGGSLHWLCL